MQPGGRTPQQEETSLSTQAILLAAAAAAVEPFPAPVALSLGLLLLLLPPTLPACSADAGCPGSRPAGGSQQANRGGAAAGEAA